MNPLLKRIPTHDILGQRIKVGEKAIFFHRHGISFEGIVVQRGGKRWLEIDKEVWIGGIGNHLMIKG